MTEKKFARHRQRKKTMLIAIITIMLCLSSIVGVTWSLFTSNLDDGTIGINVTTGKVKVDIVDEVNGASLVGEVLDFVNPDPGKEMLFEPGATFYTEGFKIKNKGEIPIQYTIYISDDDTIDWEDLKKAFEFWLTKTPKDLTQAKLLDFKGKLEVGKTSETYYLVVRMRENVGNEFQNREFKGIGITVYGVQGNVVE